MDLWKDNKLDQHFELSFEDIAYRFISSIWVNSAAYWPLERCVRTFLSENEPDGMQSVFDENQYPFLHKAVIKAMKENDVWSKLDVGHI